jgi:hypothetical protein
VVAVAIELQAKRTPSRDPQVAEAELLIDEVEVIVETASGLELEVGFAGALVVPRHVGHTGFHRAEDVDQAGVVAALLQDLLHPVFFAERFALADELDLQPILCGDGLGGSA